MKKKGQMPLLNSHTCQKGFPLLHASIAVALSSIIGDLEAMQDLQADVLVNLDSMLMVTDKQQIIVCDSLSLLFGLYDNAQIRIPMTNLLCSRTEHEDNKLLPILGLDDMVEFNRVIKEAGPLHKFIVNESYGLGQTTKKVLFQDKSEDTPSDKDRSEMNPGQAQFDMSNLEAETGMLSNIILISILSGVSALSIEALNANKTGSNSNISDLFLLKQDQIHDVSVGLNKKNISDKVVKSTDESFESSINDSATKLNLGKSAHDNADVVNNDNPTYEIQIESVSRKYLEDNNITLEDSIFDHEDVQIGLLDVNDDDVKDIVVYNKNSSATIFIDGSSELLLKNNERLFFKSISDPMLYSSEKEKEIQKEFLDEIFSDQLYYESGLKSHYDSCVKGARWLLQNASLQQTGEWPDLYSIGIRGNAWDMLENLIYHGASYQMLSGSSLSEDVTSLHGLRLFHEYNNSLDITVVDYYKNFNMESVVYRDADDDINMSVTREYFVDGSYQEYYSSDVISVTPARYAMAVVHRNGDVSTYGIEGLGGGETVSNQLKNIVEVYANDLSFLALDSDKKLHSWGHVSAFGDIPSYVEAKDVVSTSLSYAIAPANLSDRITLLGHKQYGGYYSGDSDVLIKSDLLSSDGSSYYIVKESDDIAFGKVNHYNEHVFSSYESYLSELDRIKLINDKYVMESISSLDSLKNMDLMKGDIIFTAYYLSDYTIIGYESPGINHATHVSYVAEKNDELYVVSVEYGWIHAYTLDDFINMNTDHFMLPVAVARPDYASLYRSSDNYANEYTLIVGDEVSGQFIDRDSNYIDTESQIYYVDQKAENTSTSLYGYGVAQADHEGSKSVLYVNDLPYQIDTVLHAVALAIIQQESSGNYNIVNQDTYAIGYGQVMRSTYYNESTDFLGYDISMVDDRNPIYNEFKNDPELQLNFLSYLISKYHNLFHGDFATDLEHIKGLFSVWYSGDYTRYNDVSSVETYDSGTNYPPVFNYVESVYKMFLNNIKSSINFDDPVYEDDGSLVLIDTSDYELLNNEVSNRFMYGDEEVLSLFPYEEILRDRDPGLEYVGVVDFNQDGLDDYVIATDSVANPYDLSLGEGDFKNAIYIFWGGVDYPIENGLAGFNSHYGNLIHSPYPIERVSIENNSIVIKSVNQHDSSVVFDVFLQGDDSMRVLDPSGYHSSYGVYSSESELNDLFYEQDQWYLKSQSQGSDTYHEVFFD